MTAPFLKPIPRLRCTRIACAGGLLLCLLGQDASAADVLVVTDSRHPVQSASGARVIELDLPERIEAELAAGLPADPGRAAALVQQRLRDGSQALQRRIGSAAGARDRMVEHARLDFLQRAAAVQNARTQVVVLRTGQPGQLTARVQAGLHRLRLVREKMLDFHHAALARQDHAPLDQVFQLAHVARPVVLLQCLQGSLSKAREARVVQRAKAHQHAC